MNPTAFEYKSSYLHYLASEVFSNRFFEFVQSNYQDEKAESLPSVFGLDLRQQVHFNSVYEITNSVVFSPRLVEYWDEYFGRFHPKPLKLNPFTKEAAITELKLE
jgi:hypothetical protein